MYRLHSEAHGRYDYSYCGLPDMLGEAKHNVPCAMKPR